jgi:uncharacterized cupredoxin-like copper-binding protein
MSTAARLLALCCSLLFAACASPWASAGGNHVQVSMREYSVTPSTSHIHSGNVTFDVNNRGSMAHEMVVLQTILPAQSLPSGQGDTVNEDAPGVKDVGEVSDLSPGQSKSVTVDLQPGRYLLVCNQPGHLHAGMWSVLMVTS